MEWHRDLSDPGELLEALKTDIFRDQVHVFTPRGEILSMPAGATALDFAYRVHTMVGHRCRGARINEQIVPIQTALKTGDRVEVLTKKQAGPSRDWIHAPNGYLKTASARHKVRQWFRQQDRDKSIAAGRELVERDLVRAGIGKLSDEELESVVSQNNFSQAEELYAAVGFGDLSTQRVVGLCLEKRQREKKDDGLSQLPGSKGGVTNVKGSGAGKVSVDGIDDVMSQPANCCHPVPGDPVVGYISRGRGLVIHRRDCPNLNNGLEPERLMELDWGAEQSNKYPVVVEVLVLNRPGSLRDVAAVFTDMSINLDSANILSSSEEEQRINLHFEVQQNEKLMRLLHRLTRLESVLSARRIVS